VLPPQERMGVTRMRRGPALRYSHLGRSGALMGALTHRGSEHTDMPLGKQVIAPDPTKLTDSSDARDALG
jgi:hypothetical protein